MRSPTFKLLALANSDSMTTLFLFSSLALIPRPLIILAVPAAKFAEPAVVLTPLIWMLPLLDELPKGPPIPV